MADFESLNNPVWSALNSDQSAMARRNGKAARYHLDVSPFVGLEDLSPPAFSNLRDLVEHGEEIVLLSGPLAIPTGWQVCRQVPIFQMFTLDALGSTGQNIVELNNSDVPEMIELAELTRLDAFCRNTITTGSYFGIRGPDGRLNAMAGQRFALKDFSEISAVCTRPELRRSDYAVSLISFVANAILNEGKLPFLHVGVDDHHALSLCLKLGFMMRCSMLVTVMKLNSLRGGSFV